MQQVCVVFQTHVSPKARIWNEKSEGEIGSESPRRRDSYGGGETKPAIRWRWKKIYCMNQMGFSWMSIGKTRINQLLSYFSFAFCTLLSNSSNLKESRKMGLFFVAVSKELLSFLIVVLLSTLTLQGLIDRYGASLDTQMYSVALLKS